MIGRRQTRQNSHIICIGVMVIVIQLTYLNNQNWFMNENKICTSLRESLAVYQKKLMSLCSTRATQRGFGQKILAISLFGPIENKGFTLNNTLMLLRELISETQQIYSDNWVLRVYHDEKFLSKTIVSQFERTYLFVDFCNVTELGLSFIPPKIWRFLPATDDTVHIMASRDLDSPFTARERAAMDEWILSNLTFHTMRDHPEHVVPLLGGMWAFRVEYDREFSKIFQSKIFNRSLITRYSLNRDQLFLAEHLWPYAADKAMAHASYWCTNPDWNRHHRPFPTQRPDKNVTNYCFVGCPKPCCIHRSFEQLQPCPTECRPKEHHNWMHC